ncbi:zinc-binding dehydrogenase, partial [Listeria monocytogenes]|uniref:zinc-binding dehydrogenase n=1 Tax=Listeria monocytogenes TaxID=1639 RepID=UPI000ABA70DB
REIAEKHGTDATFEPITSDVGLEVKRRTGKLGADAIIETSENAAALQAALRGIAYGGTNSYVALAKSFSQGFNLGWESHINNAKIAFSRAVREPKPDYTRWERKCIEEQCWELLMNCLL